MALTTKAKVTNVAVAANVHVSEIFEPELTNTKNRIVNRFVNRVTLKSASFLWEHFTQDIAIYDPQSWSWIKEFLGDEKVILFFYEPEQKFAFRFNSGFDAFSVLNNGQYVFTDFYLTNEACDYLLCFNHHQHLIACGAAKDWLREKIKTAGEQ